MTNEIHADNLLLDAKIAVKRAVTILDPAPAEPVATAMLKALDSIDEARAVLARRGPGREARSGIESAETG